MDKKQIISKLEKALPEMQKYYSNIKGLVIYGSFASRKEIVPSDVDLLLLFDNDPIKSINSPDNISSISSVEAAKKYLADLDPLFHINNSYFLFLEDPEMLRLEFDFWNIDDYYFIGDRESGEKLEKLIGKAKKFN